MNMNKTQKLTNKKISIKEAKQIAEELFPQYAELEKKYDTKVEKIREKYEDMGFLDDEAYWEAKDKSFVYGSFHLYLIDMAWFCQRRSYKRLKEIEDMIKIAGERNCTVL